MLKIPFFENPGSACALACYTMTANVIWPFSFWIWMMDQGIQITDFDTIDYEKWSEEGIEGLRDSLSQRDFEYYQKVTKDIDALREDIKKVFEHKNFTYHKRSPVFLDLEDAFKNGAVCEVTLNSATLDKEEDFLPHRVVILDITKETITFHDPRKTKPYPKRCVDLELFKKAWLEADVTPELCVYQSGS
jgi:hypothetical protein